MVTRHASPGGLDRVRTESGDALEAHFRVVSEAGHIAVYLESRSGALRAANRRNPDYNKALWYILARLGARDAVLLDATVESTETHGFAPDQKRLVVGHAYPMALGAHDPGELRLLLTRAQRVVGRPADAGRGGNNTKRIRLLIDVAQGAADVDAVRDLLIHGSPDPLKEATAAIGTIAGRRRGQSFASDTVSKMAVEDRGMAVARLALEAEGWSVQDVSRDRSYDFHCRRGNDELRVEVKGTRGGATEILVTANEVQHAREHGTVALAIVSGITINRGADGRPDAGGGELTWHRPWSVDHGTLVPLAYSWSPWEPDAK